MAEPIKTPLEPGLIARVAQGIRYIVTGASDAWMGPNQPTPPQADSPTDQTKGRAFDYRAGVNLDLRPKTPEGGIDFTILRGLADAYDLVRLCIETRKDQICAQDWTPDMVRQFQDWWDGVTTNTTKRKGRFIPGGTTFIDTKQSAMGPGEQVMNEWLARVVCFAFSISPTSLVASNNRATSDSQKEQAEDEGLKPAKRWLKRLIDYIVATYFGYPDIEFSWVTSKEIDALKQAQIDQIYLANKVVTADEVRVDNLGKEPLTDEQKEQISAANPAPVMMNPNADQNPDQEKPPNGEGPSGEGPTGAGSSKAETIHIHMPEIKTGDTLVEIGGTVVKVEQADGKVSEIRTDGRS